MIPKLLLLSPLFQTPTTLAVTCATWSADGRTLVLSSKDGFCSFVRFDEGEFGEEVEMPKLPRRLK